VIIIYPIGNQQLMLPSKVLKQTIFMKKLLIITIIFSLSSFAYCQEKVTLPKITPNKKAELNEPEIVTFPITAKKSTDPNYEKNKAKSEAQQKRLDTPKQEVIKDDQYYTEKITELKRRIKEIQDNPNDPNINHDKLSGLTDKLSRTEQEYITFKANK
jgi:hypothetical protein